MGSHRYLANFMAGDFARSVLALMDPHQRIRPYTTRDKAERFNRQLADEVVFAYSYPKAQARRGAIGTWVNH